MTIPSFNAHLSSQKHIDFCSSYSGGNLRHVRRKKGQGGIGMGDKEEED